MSDTNKAVKDYHEASAEFQRLYEEVMQEHKEREERLWNSLTKEQQLDIFCAVCRRIHQGDIKDAGSYRYVLYEVFGFEPDAYSRGMECGYMTLHNSIVGAWKK